MNLLDRLETSRYAELEPVTVRATSDAAGFEHHVARWPLRPEHPATILRPSILGGCFDHVELPTAQRMRRDLPALGFDPPPADTPLVFLDTETTGLMGSGAFVFVIGIAHMEADELVVEQWTLRGVSAEDAMLHAALARVDALGGALATFNGSSFDLPLLRRRARTYGLEPSVLERPHFDLLHVSRRMWQGLQEDCRLVTLERTYLGVHRNGDIEGHLIPATFWEALRKPDDPASERRLALVRMHNHGDVVSLAALIPRIATAVRSPDEPLAAVRSARHLVSIGDLDGALARLEPWLRPSEGRAEHGPRDHALALLAAELLRRTARHEEAAGVWRWVCTHFEGDPIASEALAKHLEHRARDLEGALAVARTSASPCARRIARLQRKLDIVDPM